MEFKSLMHIAFYTDQLDQMLDFYVNKLGMTKKSEVNYSIYLDRDDRPALQKIAREEPDRIFNIYLEAAPGQFIELFTAHATQKEHTQWDEHKGYSHFALLVDDIFKTRDQLLAAGVELVHDISKGPSETYQMWLRDPDGNYFEVMQYTEKSIQLVGNC
ncbi:channel protein [Streptococcus bovimastitidis]|uniref:Channel protein n=1 Tax=Streptococcus bovimastitidis TaxID=1856638 RepID=A0A1L8MKY7_9STRE|nr:VOC family protein [Streptococcus bovimastitidis]OJF71427.1 channel protein [Streptococcus bovimastitidis]